MPLLDSSEGGHCFFFQFWPPGELFVMWFPEKSAIGGGVKRGGVLGDIMVNHKNAVEIFFFLFQLLNALLDQFMDCKLCIVMYYKFTVHKLVQNSISKLKFANKRYRHPAKLRLSRYKWCKQMGKSLFFMPISSWSNT